MVEEPLPSHTTGGGGGRGAITGPEDCDRWTSGARVPPFTLCCEKLICMHTKLLTSIAALSRQWSPSPFSPARHRSLPVARPALRRGPGGSWVHSPTEEGAGFTALQRRELDTLSVAHRYYCFLCSAGWMWTTTESIPIPSHWHTERWQNTQNVFKPRFDQWGQEKEPLFQPGFCPTKTHSLLHSEFTA